MWVRCNPNPAGKLVGDCVIRAVSIASGMTWDRVYYELYQVGMEECDMMSSDAVWGLYLYRLGFEPFLLPESCPQCTTVREFARRYSEGTYIIGTGGHAVCVKEGNWYDTWDSGDAPASFFWADRTNRRDKHGI